MRIYGGRAQDGEVNYLFIDGAYLRERAKAFCAYWFSREADVNFGAVGAGFTKVFYYDCLPAKSETETQEAYAARVEDKEAFFDHLRLHDGWHVVEGVSKRRKKGPASQKEVDILISVDMLTHAYRKNMDRLAFIAGDHDFRPLLDAVVRDGMYVELWYDPKSISKELKDTADARRELDFFSFHAYLDETFRVEHPAPGRVWTSSEIGVPNGILKAHGCRGGSVVARLWKSTNDPNYYITSTQPVRNRTEFVQFNLQHDVELLKRVYVASYGDLEWKPT